MSLTGRAQLAGVMGWPVSHSLSPLLHGFWLAAYGIDGAYLPLAVRPEDFSEALAALPRLGFRGVNITMPHKAAAFSRCDRVDQVAQRMKVVNTIVVGPDRELAGYNTDGYGFIQALIAAHPGWSGNGMTAMLCGTGGAASAIAVALLTNGVAKLALCNRTRRRAEQLAERISDDRISVTAWPPSEAVLSEAKLLVNATSLGMAGQPPAPIALVALPPDAIVYDIVYNPLTTPLLAAARQRGLGVVDGLGMLLHQARPGFRSWFGTDPEVTPALRAHLIAALP